MHKEWLFIVLLSLFAGAGMSPAAEPQVEEVEAIRVENGDWPWWRGPSRDGVADPAQQPPVQWSATRNVRWKAPIPGRGHGSVTVVGEQVLLATAVHEDDYQAVMCFDRQTGTQVWKSIVHHGGVLTKGNKKASQASTTVACDGTRIFVNFLNDGAVFTTALSRSGEKLWQTKITNYVVHQGYGSSPALYKSLVLVTADNKGGGAVAALRRDSGKIVWLNKRPKKPNYASPVILKAAGREQIVLTGCDRVSSFDLLTGKTLWEIDGATTECVTSTVTDGQLVFTSGGYPKNHIAAVRADGSGEVVWENKIRVYVPSMLISRGYLYAVLDAGVATCWRAQTGEEIWKGRLGGTFSASPVLVGEHIYATNEDGRTFVFKANPNQFELVSRNDLGDEVIATPAICGSRIYMRVAEMQDDQRQEVLYCLEQPK